GSLAKASELRVCSNATELLITYLPNDGPLKNGTSPIEIGLSIDQGEEQFFTMSEAADGTWTFRRSFADITSLLELAFRDSSPVPLVDRSGGDAWILDATQFGQSAVQWLGNTMSFPAEGAITSANDLWIDVEAYPRGTAVGGKVVFTIDDGASWQETPLNLARVVGNNDLLNANLGKFPGGTTLQFAIQVVDANGLERWDNNSGNNYTRSIQFGTTAIGWSGRVNHWPLDGAIEPTDDLWINIESWPQGACIGGEVHYSLDEGVSWEIRPLAFRNAQNNNDFWNCNLGKFAAGTTIQYAVKLTDTTGAVYWHGQQTPFTATVNGVASSLTQIDAPQALGWLEPVAPMATLRFGGDGALMMDVEQQNSALSYQIERTDDLGDWEKFPAIPVSDPGASIWQVMEAGQTSGIGRMFFRVRATGGTTQQITAGQAARVSVRTNPGGATAANLVFTADGGQSWQQLQMLASPGDGSMDEWTVVMPSLSGPAELRYAIELIDQQGRSQWMNNGGNDYRESVITP
ncbi:MAG: hypothetical protein ACO3RV_04600, partial [Luteolibacter sp.]